MRDLALDVLADAKQLTGRTLASIAREVGREAPRGGVSMKGRVGELVERALGASGGSGVRRVDFPAQGVELKTIPVDLAYKPHESTFVAAVDLGDDVDWDASWVRQKLTCVLFVPIVGDKGVPVEDRTVGEPSLFRPTPAQDAQLRADYDDIMGLVGAGRVEEVTAHLGRYLQLRPKARDGSARTVTFGREGERITTVPRGFYLRATFTRALLRDPTALP